MTALQRRRWERYRKELDVTITGPGGETLRGRSEDICEGGLGLLCQDTLSVGTDYAFSIAEIAAAPLVGTVRWCTPSPAHGANVVGVELTGLTSTQVHALAECIGRWKAEDAGREDA